MRCFEIHLKEHFSFLGEQGKDPVLTAYLPYNMTEMHWENMRRPSILLCPGGGYGFVSQREGEPVALKLLPEGYNVFVLTYSVAPHKFPTQLREVAAAMELIHSNAAQWNCDPNRVAIMGYSAGGHLAAHYSNAYDCEEVRQVFPESKPVQGTILCYPVITAKPEYCHPGSFENLTGHAYPLSADELQKFSCEELVSENTPPAFLWHAFSDKLVPAMNSLLYARTLMEKNIPIALHIYHVGQHGMATADEQTTEQLIPAVQTVKAWLPALIQWLKDTI